MVFIAASCVTSTALGFARRPGSEQHIGQVRGIGWDRLEPVFPPADPQRLGDGERRRPRRLLIAADKCHANAAAL
jgi:hypothetical protein